MSFTLGPRSLILAAPIFLALGATAFAQEPAPEPAPEVTVTPPEAPQGPTDYRFEAGVYAGGHFFAKDHGLGRSVGDSEDISPDHGGAFGLRLTFNFNRWIAAEAEGQFTPTKTRHTGVKLLVFGYRANLLFNLLPPGVFRPFILVGFGALSSLSDNEDKENGGVPSDVDTEMHAGVGFKIALTDRMGIRVDGRVMVPPAVLHDVAKVGDESTPGGPDFEALGGLYFNFGAPLSRVVVEKEVVRLPPPPNPDPDGDGVVGVADKCPLVAEDKDGFEDDDGCPDPDNDKDGIPDAQDKCPNQAETLNGIDDEDGCPEVDTDGDGILGSRDKCPDQPETFNNYKDDDGCPDEIPPEVKKFTGVIQGINFKVGSDSLLKNSFPLLNRAVKVLKDFPDVRLEISGHTDSVGKADYNRDLSQKRADSVKAYLVSQGIAADRLEAVGYGMDKPIASNKTKSGRSKNRRTEFNLIKQPGGASAPGAGAPPPGPGTATPSEPKAPVIAPPTIPKQPAPGLPPKPAE
jgi:OOP family OmpA-OmpF porin